MTDRPDQDARETDDMETTMNTETKQHLQADLLDLFRRYDLSVAVGITSKGVLIGSQDERVEARNLGNVTLQWREPDAR